MNVNKRDWRDEDNISVLARAELAKEGVTLNTNLDGLSPKEKRNVLFKERNEFRRVANKISDRTIQLVNKAQDEKGWSNEQDQDYKTNMEVIEHIGALVRRVDSLIAATDHEINHDSLSTNSETNSKILKPNQSFNSKGSSSSFSSADRINETNFGFGEYVRAMVSGTTKPEIRNALTEGTDSAGGFTVPDILTTQLIDRMRAKASVIQAGALTVPLETEKTSIARIASDPAAGWRLESGAVAESDPTFEGVTFTARSLAVLVKVSRELLDDSINMEEALMMAFAGSMAGELDRVALFGSGSAPEPQGIFGASNINEVSMGTDGAALTGYGEILDAMQSLADANSNDPSAMILAPRTWRTIAGLVDTTGQPLRPPQPIEELKKISTTSVPVDQAQGTASNASSIILGDFSQLMIGIRTSLRVEVLRETFAENLQYGFLAHLRADIQLAHPGSFAVIKGITP